MAKKKKKGKGKVFEKAKGFGKRILSKKRYLVIVAIIATIVGWVGYQQSKPDYELDTHKATKDTLIESVTAPGDIKADSAIDLHFQSSARLAWVGVKEGDTVYRGQAIASLDKTDLEKNLKKYLNLYVKERNDFDQVQEDNEDWPELADEARRETLRLLENAQMDLNNSVLDVELKNLAVELATLTSPISGVVTNITTPVAGVNVTPTTSTFSIVDPETVYFAAEISEFEVPRVTTEQKVLLTLDAFPDEVIEARAESISFTSTTTSTGGTAFIAKIPLPSNIGNRYKIGMNGEVEFVIDEKEDVLLIPITSLVEEDDKEYVWVVENQVAKKVEVKTGSSSINNIEITDGLSEGDIVIVRPPSEIKEGDKIKSS